MGIMLSMNFSPFFKTEHLIDGYKFKTSNDLFVAN